MFPDDDIRARGDRGLRNPDAGRVRTGQSAIVTIRAHAKAHTDKAAKLEYASLTERLCTEAFYAFNCAAQDMAPDCFKFLQRLSTAVLPIPTRTAQQIQDGVGVNVKAKILMIPDTTQREVDVSNEVFVFWKNKILRPGVFVGQYSLEANRFEVLGFSGSFLSEEKDIDVLKEEFVKWLAADLQSIPSYENEPRAKERDRGDTPAVQHVGMPHTLGIDGREIGKIWTMMPERSRDGIMLTGLGAMTTTAQTGGARGSKSRIRTAEAGAIKVVAHFSSFSVRRCTLPEVVPKSFYESPSTLCGSRSLNANLLLRLTAIFAWQYSNCRRAFFQNGSIDQHAAWKRVPT